MDRCGGPNGYNGSTDGLCARECRGPKCLIIGVLFLSPGYMTCTVHTYLGTVPVLAPDLHPHDLVKGLHLFRPLALNTHLFIRPGARLTSIAGVPVLHYDSLPPSGRPYYAPRPRTSAGKPSSRSSSRSRCAPCARTRQVPCPKCLFSQADPSIGAWKPSDLRALSCSPDSLGHSRAPGAQHWSRSNRGQRPDGPPIMNVMIVE